MGQNMRTGSGSYAAADASRAMNRQIKETNRKRGCGSSPFIYFERAFSNEVRPQKGESKELYWFTKEEIESNDTIKPHVKVMALDALRILSNI